MLGAKIRRRFRAAVMRTEVAADVMVCVRESGSVAVVTLKHGKHSANKTFFWKKETFINSLQKTLFGPWSLRFLSLEVLVEGIASASQPFRDH